MLDNELITETCQRDTLSGLPILSPHDNAYVRLLGISAGHSACAVMDSDVLDRVPMGIAQDEVALQSIQAMISLPSSKSKSKESRESKEYQARDMDERVKALLRQVVDVCRSSELVFTYSKNDMRSTIVFKRASATQAALLSLLQSESTLIRSVVMDMAVHNNDNMIVDASGQVLAVLKYLCMGLSTSDIQGLLEMKIMSSMLKAVYSLNDLTTTELAACKGVCAVHRTGFPGWFARVKALHKDLLAHPLTATEEARLLGVCQSFPPDA